MGLLQSLFSPGSAAKATEGSSAVNVITYLASLASNPREIDPMLDGLREITSRLAPGAPLSERDQVTLASLYAQLIQYLVEHESLRKFTRDELSAKVREHFKPDATSSIFWQKVTI